MKSLLDAPPEGHAPPRIRHVPPAHSNAWEDVVDLMAGLGIDLDSWQQEVLQVGLGERADGNWAARQVGVSAPRQNGKSEVIVARALSGVLLFGERTIIISAHQQDTAREVFNRIADLVENNPALAARVEQVHKAVGREYVKFKNRAVIRFKSRASGSGRGFSCDCLLLDEAQILSASAWSSILPTMSARENPQAWLLGTPPTREDDLDGEVFGRIRATGIEGKSNSMAYLEWSADRVDPITDPVTWWKANPAYGIRITAEAIESELESMSPEQFRCERLGIWPESLKKLSVVSTNTWKMLIDPGPPDRQVPSAFGVSMSRDGRISVGACWHWVPPDGDDTYHVEEVWAGSGVPLAVEWIAAVAGRRVPVLIDEMSPAAQMAPALKAHRVRVHKGQTREVVRGGLLFETMANEGTMTHNDQPALNDSVLGGRKRTIGEIGGWGWGARDSSVLIHRAVAITWALLGAVETKSKPIEPETRVRKAVVG